VSRHFLAALVTLAFLAGGCGSQDPDPSSGGAPAVTIGDVPYEDGGADGSGADGKETDAARGGIAGGPDTKEPGDDADGDDDQQQQENR
jgi:hypothetical protein